MSEPTGDQYDGAMVRTWLDVLFINTPGLIHVCATDNWAGQAFTDHDQAAAYTRRQHDAGRQGIYLRVTTLNRALGPGERGGDADAAALPGLWADIDILGPGHKETDLPPDEEAARKIVITSGLPAPTLWVHSGGGLYPWWLLDRPADIDGDNLGEIQAMSAHWQAVLTAAAHALGWRYGPVGDLARVLRIPGTVNRKEGLARPCRVIEASPHRYTLDQLRAGLDKALAAMPEPEPAPVRHLAAVPRADGGTSPGDDFEARVGWDDPLLLGGLRWRFMYQRGGTSYWQREGKTGRECSATTGRAGDRDRLWVFSTSTIFDTGVPYTKFGAYALIHHGGKHTPAAAALRSAGYGTPSPEPARLQAEALAELMPAGTPLPSRPRLVVDGTSARVLSEPAPAPEIFGATEAGMARALVAIHGHNLRYCPQRGKWLGWTGHRWEWDDAEWHRELIKTMARTLPTTGGDWKMFSRRAESAAGVAGIERLARSDRAVVVNFNQLDADPWALNTPAGTIDLRTGHLLAPDPARLCTRSTMCAPDSNADPGRWREFLADTFDNPELIAYLQRLVGYSAVGVIGPHVLPFCFGSGGNGKGVFLESVTGVLGDYATTAPVGFLMTQAHAGHETEIARLAGARMVVCSEVNEGDRFDEAKVKQLTGGDTLTARFMRQDHFSFTPTHQLWLMGNHRPEVRSGGRSFWRRLRLVPFTHEVPADRVIDDLQGIMVREHGPAIMAWIAAGAAAYAAGGLSEPQQVKAATAEYEADQDSLARFVDEHCHLGGGNQVSTKVSVVREAYDRWCRETGDVPVSAKALTVALRSRFSVEAVKGSKGVRMYAGIALISETDDAVAGES